MSRRSSWVTAAALIAVASWWLPTQLLRLDGRLWTLKLYRSVSYFEGRPVSQLRDAWGRPLVLCDSGIDLRLSGLPGPPILYSTGLNGIDEDGAADDIDVSSPEPLEELLLDVTATAPWLGLALAALVLRRGLRPRPRAHERTPRARAVVFALLVTCVCSRLCQDAGQLVPSWGPTSRVGPAWSAAIAVFFAALGVYGGVWRLAAEREADPEAPARVDLSPAPTPPPPTAAT